MIYWINLERSPNRRIYMEKQFTDKKLEHTRISGIIVNSVPQGIKITKAEYGCLQSHLKAIHQIKNGEQSYGIVMEDDVCLSLPINFDNIIKSAPDDWEILQLFMSYTPHIKQNIDILKKTNVLWQKWITPSYGAAVYIINKKGCDKIINKIKNISECKYKPHIDIFIYKETNTYTSLYPLFYSDIKYGSEIHIGHLPKHNIAMECIKNIHKTISIPKQFM